MGLVAIKTQVVALTASLVTMGTFVLAHVLLAATGPGPSCVREKKASVRPVEAQAGAHLATYHAPLVVVDADATTASARPAPAAPPVAQLAMQPALLLVPKALVAT